MSGSKRTTGRPVSSFGFSAHKRTVKASARRPRNAESSMNTGAI